MASPFSKVVSVLTAVVTGASQSTVKTSVLLRRLFKRICETHMALALVLSKSEVPNSGSVFP
eukprot:scaffold2219_cov177-Amphora_coffeaeformis.AAC.18